MERVYDYLQKFCFPEKTSNLFAFDYVSKVTSEKEGWNVYNVQEEFKRIFRSSEMNREGWRMSEINVTYGFCSTYPKYLYVPYSISDEELSITATFRSKERIPILCWRHPYNKASISRCSQPKVGLGTRCIQDENLFQAILKTNPGSSTLYLMDARPRVNVVANRVAGGGNESTDFYENIVMEYLGIDNIHVMRDSLNKLKSLCLTPLEEESRWFSILESTRWLEFISLLISSSLRISKLLLAGTSVVVHCSDGWDRTSQLVCLSLLFLDSYYRTIIGFEVLLEKEFITVGHKFEQRSGHGQKNYADSQRAPIFLQFIDTVYQLLHQFPTYFQFNESFLLSIMENLFSCLYGTFLCNNDKERDDLKLKKTTASLWTYINTNISKYTNPHYNSSTSKEYLYPSSDLRYLKLWSNYYLAHNKKPYTNGSTPSTDTHKLCESLQVRIKELEDALAAEKLKTENLIKSQSSPRAPLSPNLEVKSPHSPTPTSSFTEEEPQFMARNRDIMNEIARLEEEIKETNTKKKEAVLREEYDNAKIFKTLTLELVQKKNILVEQQLETIQPKLTQLNSLKKEAVDKEQFENAAQYKQQIFKLEQQKKQLERSITSPDILLSPRSNSKQQLVDNGIDPMLQRDSVVDLRNMIKTLLNETQQSLQQIQ